MVKRHVLTTTALFSLLLGGCSLMAPPSAPGSAPVTAPADGGELPSAEPRPEPLRQANPATLQMIAAAENWQSVGDDARAAAALERAIRIDPGHPLPWLRLAELRYDGGDIAQAENLALKARNLAPRESAVFGEAEALILRIQKTPL